MKTSKSVFALSLLTTSLLVACGGSGSTAATPTTPTTPKPPAVAGNTCTSVATGTGVANLIADTVSCGLGDAGSLTVTQTIAFLAKGVATATGYTGSLAPAIFSLTGPSWVAYAPSATTPPNVDLAAAGWTPVTNITATNTATTITTTPNSGGAIRNDTQVTYFDLAGKPIVCLSATGCAVPGNYPAGSAAYDSNSNPVTDDYSLSLTEPFNNFASAAITDGAGVALTAMPVLGTTTFCENSQGYAATVYQPIAAPAAGAANYNEFQSFGGTCTAAGITAALAGTPIPVTLNVKATGIAGVSVIASTSNLSLIFAAYQGKVYPGNFEPAGGWPLPAGVVFTPAPILKNLTAINAELVAAGKPALP